MHASMTILFFVLLFQISNGNLFRKSDSEHFLKGHVIEQYTVASPMGCALKCISLQPHCKSYNYIKNNNYPGSCEINNSTKYSAPIGDFVRQVNADYFEPLPTVEKKKEVDSFTDGPWTLIARFSNSDEKNWMKDRGTWWYDREEPYGEVMDPSDNHDMISEAFWSKTGSEFKITSSGDTKHTALLITTGDCLRGQTFRAKMASYGIFRESTSWAVDACRGKSSVVYGEGHENVAGFGQASCDGTLQTRRNIGFWCDFESGDGAVLMIGGGGTDCDRAAHGIGITEENDASFKTAENEDDFGDNHVVNNKYLTYSLNLWIK